MGFSTVDVDLMTGFHGFRLQDDGKWRVAVAGNFYLLHFQASQFRAPSGSALFEPGAADSRDTEHGLVQGGRTWIHLQLSLRASRVVGGGAKIYPGG